MGNCLDLFSSEEPSASPSRSAKRLPAADYGGDGLPRRRFDCFAPILPFRTPSNLNELYLLGSELGRGQFGIIRICTERTSGTLFACKSISKLRMYSLHDVKDVICEINIMRRLSDCMLLHPDVFPGRRNLVHLHEVVEDSFFVHLILELCNGGELFDRIAKVKCFSEAQAAGLMESLLEALKFSHSIGIMHRDLKPENVLFVDESDKSDIKLADFGLALEFSPGQKFSGIAGSAYYMAPEILQGEYSEEIDMWSAGVIMYVLLCGMPPFLGHTDEDIFQAIQHGQLDLTSGHWKTISQSAKDLIAQMLCVNVNLRCTPSHALEHSWFRQNKVVKTCGSPPSLITDWSQNMECGRTLKVTSSQPLPISLVMVTHKEPESPKSPDTSITEALPSTDGSGLVFSSLEIHCSKLGLIKLKEALAASFDAQKLSLSGSLSKLRRETGWTCTLITTSAVEEVLMIDMVHQRYLVVHDRLRKRIAFKELMAQRFYQKEKRTTLRRRLQKHQLVFDSM